MVPPTFSEQIASARRSLFASDSVILISLALVKLLLHLVAIERYGYFRDELYYLACSEHLDWGYVDHPPLSILLLAANRWLLGDSLPALRILPALAGSATVVLVGLIAREMGGGRFAQGLAALAAVVAPAYLVLGSFYSMNSFEILLWTIAVFIVLRIVKTGRGRLWIWFGAVAGIGLQNKISMAFLGLGLLAGLLMTPHRRMLREKWIWGGGIVAALFFVPYLLWQIQHDWPTLEFMRNAQRFKIASISPVEFGLAQMVTMHPLNILLWGAGMYFLFTESGRPYRVFGWMFAALFIFFAAQSSKPYYLSPAYPVVLAAGAIALHTWIARTSWGWARPIVAALTVLGGALTAPLALPILPVETLIRYISAVGFTPASSENQRLGKLPQHFADMFGWEEMVEVVARVYHQLPDEERARTAVYTQNYGEAGAIDFFGKRHGLPKAISGHNNYYLWGPRGHSGEIVIVIGGRPEDHRKSFEKVEQVGLIRHEYAMPYESELPVFICRKLVSPIEVIWPRTRRYI